MLFKNSKTPSSELVKQFRLQVKTEIENLIKVLQWFEKVTKPFLSDKTSWQCQLALAEAFTNAVRYAHKDLPSQTPIDLEVNVFIDYLEIRLWDFGQSFNLHEKLDSILASQEDPLEKEGDRGLFLMNKLTDNLEYLRISNKRNCLIMHKKL